MVDSIIDVERNLLVDQYTVRELKTWMQLRENSRRNYMLGSVVGGLAGWFAPCFDVSLLPAGQRLNIVNRLFITAGTACGSGFWALDRALKSHLDCVLSLDGTRLQAELAASMMKRYPDHPKYKELFRKHFYPENVYDDSSDIPTLRWRWRNIFIDDAAAAFEAVADDHNSSNYKSDLKRTVKKEANSKPAQINTSVELMDDPFDIIFGTPTGNEENQSSGGSNVPRTGPINTTPKRHTHGSKRHHHRRHRKHHHEGSDP